MAAHFANETFYNETSLVKLDEELVLASEQMTQRQKPAVLFPRLLGILQLPAGSFSHR